jgi:hypothetical protein
MSGVDSDYDAALDQLSILYEKKKRWIPKQIHVGVATSMADDNPQVINLMDTLGYSGKRAIASIDDSTSFFLLKNKYSSNTAEFRSQVLAPLFVYSCKQAGFAVYMKGWEKARNHVKFVCQRCKYHKTKQGSMDEQAELDSLTPPDNPVFTGKSAKRTHTTNSTAAGVS